MIDDSAISFEENNAGVQANLHLLNRLVETDGIREVKVAKDIFDGQGVKLLAKGARVDAKMRERLLAHKLAQPLEQSVQILEGVVSESLGPVAEELQGRYPLLATLCKHEFDRPVAQSLANLSLNIPVQTLLTLYADQQGGSLEHCVGVAMLSLALSRRLIPSDMERHRRIALAGLLHDVGELYIDPECLKARAPLSPENWRHIVSHPIIGYRVLRSDAVVGTAVAEIVLNHHERLDGFGYPRGVGEGELALDSQILATSEWLMALIETSEAPLSRASLVSRLMPGEFGAPLTEVLRHASGTDESLAKWMEAQTPLTALLPRLENISNILQRFDENRAWIEEQISRSERPMQRLLQQAVDRMHRIKASFSSSGMDSEAGFKRLLDGLSTQEDPFLHQEVANLIREFAWRMNELERACQLRANLLSTADAMAMRALVDKLRGEPYPFE